MLYIQHRIIIHLLKTLGWHHTAVSYTAKVVGLSDTVFLAADVCARPVGRCSGRSRRKFGNSEEESQSSNSQHGWWMRSRTRAKEGAALPPPPSDDQDQNPELNDPELLPQPKQEARTADSLHPHVFHYTDDSLPPRTITRLYRYGKSVRVVDLNLRPGSRAYKAA